MKWYLIVVFFCVSLMTNDVEHVFMCPLAICVCVLEKYLFMFFAHFVKNRVFLLNFLLWALIRDYSC